MLQIQNFKKQYGEQLILRIDNLEIENTIYWVKGQNGAGKTTFFKSISGLISFSGRIAIDDLDLNKQPQAYRLAVNYAEAEPIYPTFLTGRELLDFYISSQSADKAESDVLLDLFGIKNYLSNPIGTYSSGMMKKLSILLAFIGKPRFILLDEPLVTIEDSFLPFIYDLIVRHNKDKQVGFLISSHQALDPRYLPDSETLHVANQTVLCGA